VRPLRLTNFNVTLPEASVSDISKTKNPFHKLKRIIQNRIFATNWYKTNTAILSPKDGSYLEGWWQTDDYFKDFADAIRSDFTPKKPLGVSAQSLYLKIKELKEAGFAPVSLHIRRGDYVTNKHAAAHHGVLQLDYYYKAIEEIQKKESKNIQLFVFSDDINWAKQHLQTKDITINYVSSPDIQEYEELVLMSNCSHHIIANSSFSWWGAWLNPSASKVVVGPKQWIQSHTVDTTNATPSDWIRI
jgi:hypothetical protein